MNMAELSLQPTIGELMNRFLSQLILIFGLIFSGSLFAHADCGGYPRGTLANGVDVINYTIVDDNVTLEVTASTYACDVTSAGRSYWKLIPALSTVAQKTMDGKTVLTTVEKMEAILTDANYQVIEIQSYKNAKTQTFTFKFKATTIFKNKSSLFVSFFPKYYTEIKYSSGKREQQTAYAGAEARFELKR